MTYTPEAKQGLLHIPRAIVFDWDNTLIDNWAAIACALNNTFAKYGHEIWTLEQVKKNCARAARESFPDWFGPDWQEPYDHFYHRFGEVHLEGLTILSGADELLSLLKIHKIPAVVVSNKRGDYLRKQVAALGWELHFGALIGSSDAQKDKPMRDPVDLALGKVNVIAGEDIWFVGDSEIDMVCARNAGCTPVFLGDAATAARLSVARFYANCNSLHGMLYDCLKRSR